MDLQNKSDALLADNIKSMICGRLSLMQSGDELPNQPIIANATV